MSKTVAAAVLILVSSVVFAFAQDEPLRVRSSSTAGPGELDVIVIPPHGITPNASDLSLRINNQVVARARDLESRNLDVILFVDVSGSMKGDPIRDAKNALKKFLQDIKQKDRLELIAFGDSDRVVAPLEASQEQLQSAIDRLDARDEKTLLFQALDKYLHRGQDANPPSHQMFVVITDGKDEGSPQQYRDSVTKTFKNSAVRVHIIFRGKGEAQSRQVLDEVAEQTGGRNVRTYKEDEIHKALKSFYDGEPRSFAVHFSYRADSTKTADGAVIVLDRSDGGLLSSDIRGNIALLASPDPPLWYKIAVWLVPLLLAAVLVAAFAWARNRKKVVVSDAENPEPNGGEVIVNHDSAGSNLRADDGRTRIAHYFPVPSAGHPAATLVGIGGSIQGQQFAMDKEILRIGANANNDVPIDDQYVSGEHASLRYENGRLLIFDQGSRNGTFVNDAKLTEPGVVLRPGDRIRIGQSTFELATPS